MFHSIFKAISTLVTRMALGLIAVMTMRLLVVTFLLIYTYAVAAAFPVLQGWVGFIGKAFLWFALVMELGMFALGFGTRQRVDNEANE